MRIESIAYKTPSMEITNDQVLDFIKHFNPDLPEYSLTNIQRTVSSMLVKIGCDTRYIRDKTKQETAFKLTKSALCAAIDEAGISEDTIDLLIYCGVGRGFLEPANAYFFANAVGLRCACFDILDACMSWTRALEIASLYFRQNSARNIVIINSEFNVYEHGFPELYKIKNLNQLKYAFPGYTIGEAATATVLSNFNSDWRFKYETYPKHAHLCTIPMKGFDSYTEKPLKRGFNEIGIFFAYGNKMIDVAKEKMIPLIRKNIKNISTVDNWFPHLASVRAANYIADSIGIERQKLFTNSFTLFGNTVSATIPISMKMALDENKLKRGNRIVLCPGSAGMSFAVVEFIY
jgi:3-oxoacyl-[acyl-carrier-protein] synthase III